MQFIILFAVLTAAFAFWGHKCYWDYVLPWLGTIISAVLLIIAIIAIPITRIDDVDFALKVESNRKTLASERQMSDFERVALAKEMMEINASLKQRQYWLHSRWYSIYHNPCVDTLKPLE